MAGACMYYRGFSTFYRYITNYRQSAKNYTQCFNRTKTRKNLAVPYTVGFSVFTWLGFADPKLTAEDDLVKSIKHSILFIQQSEFVKAEQLLHIALRQAQQIRHELGITYIYDVMANLALERNQLDKAKTLFVNVSQRLMSDGATEDDSRIIHISIKLARISHLQKEYQVAQMGYDWCISKLKNELKSEKHEGIIQMLALAEDWYGRMFMDFNQYEQAFTLMQSAFNRMKELPNIEKEQLALQMNDLGTICINIDKLDESIEYFQSAIDLAKTIEKYEDIGIMYVNKGNAYLRKNMIDEARKSCGYAWKLGTENKNKEILEEAESCLKQIKSMN